MTDDDEDYVVVLYYSHHGATQRMAEFVARGIERVSNISARIRTVPKVSTITEASEPKVPETGAPYVSETDLANCKGLIIGSPTRFGNMAAPLKYFIDSTLGLWLSGALIGKPAGCFTSSSSLHGGQETTLISMMLPLIHHGAVIVGVPYSESALNETTSGGTPYGPSHHAGINSDKQITDHEAKICQALGERVATLAIKLK